MTAIIKIIAINSSIAKQNDHHLSAYLYDKKKLHVNP